MLPLSPYMRSDHKTDRAMTATKIATCCYCGTKAALVLRGKSRHELSCSSCGAPLRALKMLPKAATENHPVQQVPQRQSASAPPRPRRQKTRRKSLGERVLAGLWDKLEDVIDDVFD